MLLRESELKKKVVYAFCNYGHAMSNILPLTQFYFVFGERYLKGEGSEDCPLPLGELRKKIATLENMSLTFFSNRTLLIAFSQAAKY